MIYLRHLVLLILLLLLGFGLRLHGLGDVPMRGDEAFSAQYWAGLAWPDALVQIAPIEPHPPLTYGLFSLWGAVFGIDSTWLLRLLPAMASLLGIAGIYQAARLLTSERVALIAACLWVAHPFFLWHAQDFRNYALWNGLAPFVIATALRFLRSSRKHDGILFAGVSIFTSLIFYFEIITLGIVWLYGIIKENHTKRWLIRWMGLFAFIMIFPVGSLLVLQGNLLGGGGYSGNTGGFTLNDLWMRFVPTLLWGDTYPHDVLPLMGIAGSLVTIGTTFAVLQKKTVRFLLPLMLIYLPLVAISLISLRINIFHPRYIMMVSVGFVLLIAFILDYLWDSRGRPFAVILAVGWFGIAGWGIINYFTVDAYRKAPDWKMLVTYVGQNSDEEALIIQVGVDAAFGYYYDVIAPSAAQTALPTHPNQPTDEIEASLRDYEGQFKRLWVVGSTFTDWQSSGIVEAWVQENMQEIRHISVDGIPAREYAPYTIIHMEEATALASFEGLVDLLEVIVHPAVAPSSMVVLEVYWRTIAPSERPLTSFVHLTGAPNPAGSTLWTQDDHPPQRGRLMTDMWDGGLIYRDVYKLDVTGLPGGVYSLLAGFYDEDDRRYITDTGSDVLFLGEIKIK